MSRSALYFGQVVHARLRPRRHHLRYRVYSMLIDLDEVPALGRRLRLFSHNRFNLFSFHDRDHGSGMESLRAYVERQMAAAGIDLGGGAIRLLCSPRVLGYGFNPLSVYFCYRATGDLAALIYEVNNTFGERHSYLIPTGSPTGTVRQSCAKRFYVSPFMSMALTYHFRIDPPGDALAIRIRETDAVGTLLTASLTGRRAALSDRSLLRAWFAYPLMTLAVVAGIHWEALKLWLKGVGLHKKPLPPAEPITIVAATIS